MASSIKSSQALNTLKSLANRYPTDPIRPKFQFKAAITESAHRAFDGQQDRSLNDREVYNSNQLLESLTNIIENKALNEVRTNSLFHPSMHSENTSEQFPPSQRVLRPASFPDHYEKLEVALQRISRGDEVTWKDRLARFWTWRSQSDFSK